MVTSNIKPTADFGPISGLLTTVRIRYLVLLLLIGSNCQLVATNDESMSKETLFWSIIDSQLDQPTINDSTFKAIPLLTDGHCKDDFDCQHAVYESIVQRMEKAFNLPTAVLAVKEIVRISLKHKKIRHAGHAYLNLFRFYSAMGRNRLAAVNVENARVLFEELGETDLVTSITMSKLENSLEYRDEEEVYKEMVALLNKTEEKTDSNGAVYVHIRMLHHTLSTKRYDAAAKHVAAIAAVPISDPIQPREYGILIHSYLGKAELALGCGNIDQARTYFKEGLRLCEAEPSRWLEINTLHSLARLEWSEKNGDQAKAYLVRAEEKAMALKLYELLTVNFQIQGEIAEAEERYKDALDYKKNELYYDELFKSRGNDFDIQHYYLELEKEQLATEKERKELALKLKDVHLRNSMAIIVLAVFLLLALIKVVYVQRRSKKSLAQRNVLIQEQSKRLEHLDAAKSKFFANISHELRTPLSLLLGPIDTSLKSGSLDSKNFSLLKMAHENGKDLLKLVNSILDLSKLESNKLVLQEKQVSFYPFARRAVSTFESHAQRNNIDLTMDYRADKDLQLELDTEKVGIIINNLLSNALKFTPEKGSIQVQVEDLAHSILLSVKDNGRGIHVDDIPHVFDRYYQSEQADAPTEGGTGIGLAYCNELVKLMKGKIWAKSSLGEGSTFFVELPKKEVFGVAKAKVMVEDSKAVSDVEKTIADASIAPPFFKKSPPENAARVLIVEDNFSLRTYLQTILSPFYHTMTAENGQVALALLKDTAPEQQPSLIISDVMMPIVDGYQLLEKLKSQDHTRHIPVVMLTARAGAKDRLKALRLGVDDYLLKPFVEEELLARVENLLKNYRLRIHQHAEDATVELTATEVSLLPDNNAVQQIEKPILSAENSEWLKKLEENLQEQLVNFDFKFEQLATTMLVSRRQLGRQVKALTGLTPSEYLLEARLQMARLMLDRQEVSSVKEIVYHVGLRDAKHFSRKFKKRFGKLPSSFLE